LRGQLAQLLVNQRQELLSGVGIALFRADRMRVTSLIGGTERLKTQGQQHQRTVYGLSRHGPARSWRLTGFRTLGHDVEAWLDGPLPPLRQGIQAMLVPQVRVVRCAHKRHPCPHCGQHGRRKLRVVSRDEPLAPPGKGLRGTIS
jgi:hypothetical protein